MQLCITGMHRSGTSLVASIIQKAGLDIGSNLYGPAKGNQHGHFEDRDFVKFHDAILARRGLTFLTPIAGIEDGLSLEEHAEAQLLVDQRKANPVWGWKDPRTSLFLNFWGALLPEAVFVFVYRHPLEVVLSLLRRGTDLDVVRNNLAGLRAWKVYNRAILDFYQKNPARCILCNISGSTRDITAFIYRLNSKLGLHLAPDGLAELFIAKDLNQLHIDTDLNDLFRLVDPESMDIFDQLKQVADIPGDDRSSEKGNTHPIWGDLSSLVLYHIQREADQGSLLHMLLTAIDPQAVGGSQRDLVVYVESLEKILGSQNSQSVTPVVPENELIRKKTEVKVLEKQVRQFAMALTRMAPAHSLLGQEISPRYVRFPDDYPLGNLQIRECGSVGWDWLDFGQAVGEVKVPARQELYLTIDSKGYSQLAWLASLNPDDVQSIFLGHLPVHDQDLIAFAGLSGLQTLDLRVTLVTEAGLPALYGLVNLRSLVLPNNISLSAIKNLKSYLPNCQIVQGD